MPTEERRFIDKADQEGVVVLDSTGAAPEALAVLGSTGAAGRVRWVAPCFVAQGAFAVPCSIGVVGRVRWVAPCSTVVVA